MPDSRSGVAAGIAAYLLWGLFPLYWPLLEPAGSGEILAHRISWSVLTMTLLVIITGRGHHVLAVVRDPRSRRLLGIAAVVVAINWGTYIWGVNHHRVVETSLGYFINPLVTVLMGVLILGERLRRLQWVAVAIAGTAVLGLTLEYGRPPWVALVLAFSFGTYGLAKKQASVGTIESLTFETLVLAPFALAYLLWLARSGSSHFTGYGAGHAVLLALTGLVTAVPLLFFGAAAIRVPLTTLGLLQYLAPTIQLLLGVTVLDETMSPMRWAGFCLVWTALVVFSVDSVKARREARPLEPPV